MRIYSFLAILLGLTLVAAKLDFENYRIYEVTPTNTAQGELLLKLSEEEYDFLVMSRLPGQAARMIVTPEQLKGFEALLKEHQLSSKLINDNLGATIAEEFVELQTQRKLLPITGKGRLSTQRYYTHQEINNYIEDLAARYPDRVTIKTVGWSYEKRVLKTLTVTNGDRKPNKKVVLLDGGFHAREWISPATVLYVLEQLVENFDKYGYLLKDYDWMILPVVNPDGYEYTQTGTIARMHRKTRQPYTQGLRSCMGTDPNRNFNFHWREGGASSNACSDTFAGPKPFSEPETIVVRDLLHSLKDRGIMYLTLHSYGNYLVYPWGWTNKLPELWQDLDEVARAGSNAIKAATGTVYRVGSSTNLMGVAAGASDDYAYYVGFNVSFTMELPAGGMTGFDPPARLIDEYVKEAWIGIRAMAEKLYEKY